MIISLVNTIQSYTKNKTTKMKKSVFTLLLVSITTFSFAQSKSESEVAAAVQMLRTAMIDADSLQLDKITSGNLQYAHSSGKLENKAEFIHALTSGASDFITMDLTDQTIVLSGNTAIVRHKLSGNIKDGGKPGAVNLVVMTVWQKQGKNWKLLARQAVRPPQP